MTTSAGGSGAVGADRALAMATYGMLIAAPFTLGLLAMLAIVIAYIRRGRAEPVAKSHFERQIRSFWLDVIVLAIGFICGWGALGAGIGAALAASGIPMPGNWSPAPIGIGAIVLGLIWLGTWGLGLGGFFIGSIFGAMRLASGRPAGKSRGR
jgi:uncharacterized membrane protein